MRKYLVFTLLTNATVLLSAQTTNNSTQHSMNLFDLIKQGGWAMWPLGLCSLVMLYLIIHCWRQTQAKYFVQETSLSQINHFFEIKDFSEMNTFIPRTNILNRAVLAIVTKINSPHATVTREVAETVFCEALEGEENQISQWIHYLNVIATVSPMIGLLGTVSGMIGAFQTISSGGMGRPELLAGDIGEALITTATGLVIGIPSMIAFFILRNRLNNQMLITAKTGDSLIDILFSNPLEIEPIHDA